MRETMRETMRQEIMSVWDETEKDIKRRKSLIDFLKKMVLLKILFMSICEVNVEECPSSS